MDKDSFNGQMVLCTKVNGEVALDMGMVQTFSAMAMRMWVSISLASLMVMGSTSGIMATFILVSS
jgi:hypothetical protein